MEGRVTAGKPSSYCPECECVGGCIWVLMLGMVCDRVCGDRAEVVYMLRLNTYPWYLANSNASWHSCQYFDYHVTNELTYLRNENVFSNIFRHSTLYGSLGILILEYVFA